MGGLHGDIGHAGGYRRPAGHGHFDEVRVGPADHNAPVEYGDGTVQVEMRAKVFRIMVQAVAVSPGFGLQPRYEFVGGQLPQFQHRVRSPNRSIQPNSLDYKA